MEEILTLKENGYAIADEVEYFKEKGQKAPSLPTLRKYYKLEAVPEDPHAQYAKDKVFDHTPFREVIVEILRNSKEKYCVSSVYDVLMEKYVDVGECEKQPGNEQTLRNYIKYLTDNNIVEALPKNQRIYEHVFDTPPGEQMLLDFGEMRLDGGKQVHFICLLLRYSRLFCVYAQDHRYNGEEACRDIYRAMRKL